LSAGKLQREIGKRRPFATAQEETLLNLLHASDQMQIHFTRLFREHGLTPSQYNVLRILRGEGKPLPILEIAGRTVTVVPGITGLIDRLELAGFVRRVRCETDRRVIFVAVTPPALALLARLDRPVSELQARLLSHMKDVELKSLIRLLEKVRHGKTDQGPPT
jgi:DNA-binding MarR family transcriptional regulator